MIIKHSYGQVTAGPEARELELAVFGKHDTILNPQLSEDFKRLADRSQDAIYQFDIESRIFSLFNKKFLSLYAIEENGVKTLSPRSVMLRIHPDDRDKIRSARMLSFMPKKNAGEIEYRFLHPDGSIRVMHDRWTVVRAPSGQPAAIEGFIRDNTWRKQAEKERLEKEKLLSILEMAGAVGHELNNPLQVVVTCTEKLAPAQDDDQRKSEYYRLLKDIVGEMRKTVIKFQNITQYATKDYVQGKKIIDIDAASGY